MARYIDAKCRLCRREGMKLFLKGEKCISKCVLERRKNPPGMHGNKPRKKLMDYGVRLREKQKARRIYGILEKQFKNYFAKAARMPGVTGENLLQLLERRLDNVVFRLGWGASRNQARQIVRHGHVMVNGRVVNIPSFEVRVGDTVSLKESSRTKGVIAENLERGGRNRSRIDWLQKSPDQLSASVVALPTRDQIDTEVNEQLIVEYYSR
ncbi:MAG: 30S ribosomal protein S4 [Abditibacteriales bacterium]|nr:30S ribosomal protein S4 [Abditibacteriales bacterium]MDW8365005.1 30S ribosomal protein S4 [Abditibacteriales bacterium]